MSKLIPKKQTAWGKLEYKGPQYSQVVEQMKKEDPQVYNRLQVANARSYQPNSEVVRWKDAYGKEQTSTTNIGMSGADPIGQLYVEGVVLNPVFKGLGRATQYGLAKAGNKWARAKILSREIDKSNIVANSLLPKPTVRTKVGDIEIDNPSLYYRQGSKEMADDFLETGIVDTDGAYSNPMFAQGHLWYGIPKRLTNRENTEMVTKRGFKFNFGKRNEDVAKTHLLVSNPSTDMIGANHSAHAANTLIYKQRNSPISGSDLIKYEQNLGKDFISKYQDAYYNGDLEDRMATIVTYPGGSRRIPAIKGAANKSNTQLYEYNPNYGYRLIQNNSKTYNFNQNYNKNTQPGN